MDRSLATSLVVSFCLLPLAAIFAPGCAVAEVETDDEEVAPDETIASESDELISSVDCTTRSETAYTSGRAYTIQTISIGGKRISKPTGHAFLQMQRAAHQAGVTLSLTSGFRTQSEQQYLYNCYLTKRCNNGNRAAPPGYSNHQSGIAVDVSTSSWLAANASRFGFVRTVPDEPWHYEYTRGTDPGGPCGGGASTRYPESIQWVSPKDKGWYTNGLWLKSSPSAKVQKVVYMAGNFRLGESTDRSQSFALRYEFTVLGDRSLTAEGYDASGKKVAESTITVRITK